MTRGAAAERVVAIRCGGRRGTGYLLTRELVLTAAHLVDAEADILVTLPGEPHGESGAPAQWPGRPAGIWFREASGLDIALIDVARPRPVNKPWSDQWARVDSLVPVPGCHAIGFPAIGRTETGALDTEQVEGTYRPGTGLATGRHALVVSGTPPVAPPRAGSPWAGMSGAAVHSGNLLLGVITAAPEDWHHGRLTVVPLHRMFDNPEFRQVLASRGYPEPELVRPAGPQSGELGFSEQYADYIAHRHGMMRIFGVDFVDRRKSVWPLDAAYFSLEATATRRWRASAALGAAPARQGDTAVATAPMPAEQALAAHERVLLRGAAGSGKTTLAQWLAVTSARQSLLEQIETHLPAGAERAQAEAAAARSRQEPEQHVRHLRGMVPFLLPLRTIARSRRLPGPEDFLKAVGCPLEPPAGWVGQTLARGRALMLVDGLDEIDEQARERVAEWLRALLSAYPRNRWLITTRPSAVVDSWLADRNFTELTLLPMSRRDVRAFVTRWHDAARETADGDAEEVRQLNGYESALNLALHTQRDLGRLATNPLMCGVMCALHRDRGGYLPTGRKELYEAALTMLLMRRDEERDLAPLLKVEPQVQLLQKLAYWLVKNGQAEMDRKDALGQLERALPAIAAAAALGDAETVYRYLLNRSGILREPTADTVDFLHRTFQDYLAARAVVEEMDFDLLVGNAHQDHWSDVVRMAVAHGRPRERARILRKLIERGDAEPGLRARLHLLATASLEQAAELDPEERAAVEARTARLIPPRSLQAAEALADAGPIVLESLPEPETLDEQSAALVAFTAWSIGGEIALPVLSRLAALPSVAVRQVLAQFPQGVTSKVYVREVLSRAVDGEVSVGARSVEDLLALTRLPQLRRLDLRGSDVVERLDLVARMTELTALRIGWSVSAIVDLAPLAALRHLRRVESLELVSNAEMLPGVEVVRISDIDEDR